MKYTLASLLCAYALTGIAARNADGQCCAVNASDEKVPASALDFTVKDIDGNDVDLSRYKGKVTLIVNVASKCGLTPQYEKLTALYDEYKDQGFEILAFPANNFMRQEPGSNEEIKAFCTTRYDVTFPLFSKISVKGKDIHPVYAFLTSKETNPQFAGAVGWNFGKFLLDREGKVIARFSPRTAPDNKEVVEAIKKALASEEA